MAKIYQSSSEADIDELQFFSAPDTNTSVIRKYWKQLRPACQISKGSPITFIISGAGLDYLYLKKTRIYVRCRIADRNGAAPADGDTVFPINHLLNSLWQSCEIKIQDKLITQNSNNYAYKSYIKTLLYKTDSESAVTKLGSEMFSLDDHGKVYPDAIETTSNVPYNHGAASRIEATAAGKSFELQGCLNEDIFSISKYVINGLKVCKTYFLICLSFLNEFYVYIHVEFEQH